MQGITPEKQAKPDETGRVTHAQASRILTEAKPMVIESPFKASKFHSEEEHKAYLRELIVVAIQYGYTPYASLRMLTDALDDSDPIERLAGINAGLAMSRFISANDGFIRLFGLDMGFSSGMRKALSYAAHPERDEMIRVGWFANTPDWYVSFAGPVPPFVDVRASDFLKAARMTVAEMESIRKSFRFGNVENWVAFVRATEQLGLRPRVVEDGQEKSE